MQCPRLVPAPRFLASLFALALALFAQPNLAASQAPSGSVQNYLVHTWQTDDGLPQNWVSSIAQTPDGYLWIGTRYGGLARFDGMRFVPFNPQNTPALRDVQVEHLSMDDAGRLWILMGNESITALHNNTFTLHREPRTNPRVKLARVLLTRNNDILFAAEYAIAARARLTPAGAEWTLIDPRPDFEVNSHTFCVDREKQIWALTRGAKPARAKNDRFERLPPTLAPPHANFTAITADKTGVIWAATSHRLLRWDGARGFVDATPAAGPKPESIAQIEFSGDGSLWVLEKNRLRKLLDGRWVCEIDNEQLLRHAATGTATLHGDAQGDLWLASFGHGLWHIKDDGAATLFDEQAGLASVFITTWFQDTEGNVWIGTAGGGIARIRESIFASYGHAQGLPGKVVSSVCVDKQGTLWAGTMSGGLAAWNGNHFEKETLPIPDNNSNPTAGLTVMPSADGDGIWIGSVNQGLMRMNAGRTRILKTPSDVRILFNDSKNNLWVAPLAGLMCMKSDTILHMDTNRGFQGGHAVGALAEDSAGIIWIGTGPGDLWKYENEQFTKYTPPPEWSSGRISAVLPDTDGSIWIGTLGGGLLRFHDGSFTRCTTANGLPDNNISQLLDSGDGHIWAGTYAGIFRAAKNDLLNVTEGQTDAISVRIYGRYDGLPALECTSGFNPACWRADDGMLYFSTANGVVALNPRKITENKIPPAVIIEELIIDGKTTEIPPPALRAPRNAKRAPEIEIPPGQHHVQFQVTALNFAAPDGVRFRVKLDGADTDWRNVDSRRLIGYGPLLPGKYRFHVIACNNDGVWNETGDTLAIKVLPHFWETNWFKALLLLLALVFIAGAVARIVRQRYRRRIQQAERQREMERERTRIAEDLHDDLGTSLTRISMLSALANNDRTPPFETREIIHEMDGCARHMVAALDEIVWAVNPKNDSWYELVNYLGFFAEEFFRPTNIRCRLDIPSQVPPGTLRSEERHHLFLAVKEALNNVARHSGATQVWLRIAINENEVTIGVEDDGHGFQKTESTTPVGGNGLKNMRHRMAQIGGAVEMANAPGGRGARVLFKMPHQ